ncbi:MAG: SDR family NAD(P)-dependent oxidoreductase [Gemmatimonadaceae bacterium]
MPQSSLADPVHAPASMRSDFPPIAIIGLGCRFPKAPNVAAYWRMMLDGVDGITEVPASRWDVDALYDPRPATPCKVMTRCGGFLDDIDRFDPYFFGISPREAIRMDPQQRLLLEVTWEAMENAGIPRERFTGSHTGVFMGVCTDDYITLQRGDLRNIDIYMGTGGSRGSTAGRLAFVYGLTGPTAAVDTACSSSLVAVHQACNSLQQGDCDMALAGGVNVVLHPGTAVAFSQANMLSPDGRCKAFDSRANGFVRSEGAGVVLLKPLARALADGDPVYAVIRASASNNDGSSSPFMTPSRTGQAELLRHAYERAGVGPETVQYVEAHGTGTEVGDPVEVGALADVIGAGRGANQPCILGSSKTNIGHTEAAAGVAGLIKAVLCLQNKVIPPSLHFVTPNPNIPWEDLPFRVPTVATPWPGDGMPARAGVNSFGISGTNAHVVLEEAPQQQEPREHTQRSHQPAEILTLSAHSPEVLESVAASYRYMLCNGEQDSSLRDLCYSAAVRRTHHEYRLGVVSRSREELKQKLDGFLSGEMLPGTVKGAASADSEQQPVFVLSGIGTQWPKMGQRLRATEPVFNDAMLQCDAVIRAIVGWSVLEEIDRTVDESRLGRIDIMQPAIFSIQIALTALWRSWGVEPVAVIGHSLGEIAAAHIAGALSLHDAALVACTRSRLMHRTSGRGRMAAVGMTPEQAAGRIDRYNGRISVAAINSPSSCALSGDSAAVEELATALEEEGVFCRLLKVEVACHSQQMDPLQGELAAALAGISAHAAGIPLYSTVLGRRVSGDELDGEYWARNLRQTVQFAGTMDAVLSDGRRVFLEVSPNPSLLTPIRQIAQHRNESVVTAPSLRAGPDEREVLLESVGTLFTRGCPFEWTLLYPVGKFVVPPPYVWQRERFWFTESNDPASWLIGGTGAATMGSHKMKHPLLSIHWERADEPGTHCFEAELDLNSMPALRDHSVEGMPLLPAAAYVEMALAASMEISGPGLRTLRKVQLHKALFLSPERPERVQLIMRSGTTHSRRVSAELNAESANSMSFQFFSRHEASGDGAARDAAEHDSDGWVLLASGYVDVEQREESSASAAPGFSRDDLNSEYAVQKTSEQFYSDMITGMEFGAGFRSVQRTWGRDKAAVTLIELPATTKADAKLYRIHPALLDACFHSLNAVTGKKRLLSLPCAIDSFELLSLPDPAEQLWCAIQTKSTDAGYSAEIAMYDSRGVCMIRVSGYQTQFLDHKAASPDETTRWLYEHRWRKIERPNHGEVRAGHWLIVGGTAGAAIELRGALDTSGQSCTALPGNATRDEFADVLQQLATASECQGIVHLGALDIPSDAPITAALLHDVSERTCRSLLNLLQACTDVQWTDLPRVFVVSRDAKDLGVEQDSLELAQAPLAGLARVAAIELREFQLTQIDIEADTPAEVLTQELLHADDETEVALRHGGRYALRLTRLDTSDRATVSKVRISDEGTQSYRLESAGAGVFHGLKLHGLSRRAPGRGEVEIRVAAVALNFLDVLKALNMAPGLPAGAEYFGMECSGRIVAVGDGVQGFDIGDEVIALDSTATGCFRAFLTTGASAVFAKPAHLSLEEAATIAIAYQTAYYALCDLGRLRAGESVLIHSAAGGVGLAAMEIARQRGAVIFATAGTEEKREHLRRMGAQYVMNSRTLDFADEVMEYTEGRGVDMVLNSLAGEAIPKSLGVLATGGRFLEIGKRDIYADSQIGLLPFQRNLSFFAVDLLRMRMEKPHVVDELTREVVQQISGGSFQSLPYTTFPVAEVADAFRYMAQGKHIGKIVVTLGDGEREAEIENVPQPVPIRADATYLITGGLGALGLAFARRLVDQGARHLALMGRRAATATAEEIIGDLRSRGAEITVIAADVSDAQQLSRALADLRAAGPPLRGVLHAAGVTSDRTLQQLRWDDFASVFTPKVLGGWNLHTHLQSDDLDFFVLFSSAASVLGGAGQANYAAANAFLDSLAHMRVRAGMPALSVNWGPWAEIGMAAQDDLRGARMAERGLESIPVQEGTELLDLLLQQRPAQIAVMPINWDVWAQASPESLRAPMLAELTAEWTGHGVAQAAENGIRQQLLACDSEQNAEELLIPYLRKDIAKILRIGEEKLNPRVSLIRFGLDSLMAVELKNRIESDFGVRLPAAKLLRGPSIIELAEWLRAEVRVSVPSSDSAGSVRAREGTTPVQIPVDVDALSDDQVNAMLSQVLVEGGRG